VGTGGQIEAKNGTHFSQLDYELHYGRAATLPIKTPPSWCCLHGCTMRRAAPRYGLLAQDEG
jgi:hypothetical protein